MKYVDMSACKEMTILPTKMFIDCGAVETLLLPPNVETIKDYAFYGLTGLKGITVPATVTSIGGYAFDGCKQLETVTFAEGSQLTQLGTDAVKPEAPNWGINIFSNTPDLKTVVLPENLTLIGISCFENSGVENISIPATVRRISEKAFKNCDNIKEADLSPELLYLGDEAYFDCDQLEKADITFGLEYLGAYAFANCEKLKSAYIPASVTNINGNPFMGCSGVDSFKLDEDSTDFVVQDGVLYNKDMTILLYYPASLTAETFVFPETVNQIGPGAFADAQLKHFVVPQQILEIPDYAFQGSALETVTFHAGLQTIGDYAFASCKNLNNVTLLYTVKSAGDYAFANCTGLTSFTFEEAPSTVTPIAIGDHFFEGCTGITQLILHSRIKKFAPYMFANTGIVNLVIPAQITSLYTEGVFANCKQLETVTFENLKYSANKLGAKFFYSCSKLKEIELPYGISNVFDVTSNTDSDLDPQGNYIFANCTALEKVTVYSNTKSVSFMGYTFYNCTNLKEVNLLYVTKFITDENGKVTGYEDPTPFQSTGSFGPYAFSGCYKLDVMELFTEKESWFFMENIFAGFPNKTLILKGGVTSFASSGPFANAPALKEIWINPNSLWIIGALFENMAGEVNVYFYNHTREEIVAMAGGDSLLTNAGENVHFYFKDTMPADAEWPEELKPAT